MKRLQLWDQLLIPNSRMCDKRSERTDWLEASVWHCTRVLFESGSSNVDHAEPAQPINNTDTFLEEKNTEPGQNKGRRREMKVGLRCRLKKKFEESHFLDRYLIYFVFMISD